MKIQILMIHKKDGSIRGEVNGAYFDRWYNRTEADLFLNSMRRLSSALGVELEVLWSWEE